MHILHVHFTFSGTLRNALGPVMKSAPLDLKYREEGGSTIKRFFKPQ